ncbi:MAG TPA: serine/threonine-protein kinase, partial [Polyangiaceae bacterium]|nr:serine/threonine-protein kinase [Polyangiaceae bacterium]
AASVWPEPTTSAAPFKSAPRSSIASFSDVDPANLPKICTTCQSRYPLDFLVCPRDATPLTVEGASGVDPLLGKVLGEAYQIVRLVGEGGMGRVYEARHLRLKDRRFAIKVLHPELARDPDVVARFQREAESASSIGHPNVIDVYDVHRTPDGVPYIVGEFLEGQEFGGELEHGGHIESAKAVHVTRQVCRALTAAHRKGIVHRDMKPENVFLVDRDGALAVKVIDFGISTAGQAGKTNLTKTGMIMGTPSYMAPEQARGDKVDHRADIYAVGAMLYHAVTGRKPFESDDPASTLSLVLTEEPERPRKINNQIPEALELVIQHAMAKAPEDRYQSMEDLEAALEPFDLGPVAGPGPGAGLATRQGPTLVTARNVHAADPTARTMMAASATASGDAAKLSRPTIILSTLGLTLWLACGLVDAIGGLVRATRDGDLTSVEVVLLMTGCGIIVLSGAVYFAVHIRKKVWGNSVRALELSTDLRRTFFGAFVTYAFVTLGARLAMTVIMRQSSVMSSGAWDVLTFVTSFLVASIAWSAGPIARSLRRRRSAR